MFCQRWPQLTLVSFISLVFTALVSAQGNNQNDTQVSTARLSDIAIYPQKTAPATVNSLNETSLATEIAARINAIPVRVGDVVDKDTLLASLDCTDYILSKDEASARIVSLDARIELAKKRLQRTEKLTRKQTVSEELLDEREAALAVLRADRLGAMSELQMSQANIARCKLTSPFRAVITRRVGAEGEFADKGTAVLELMDIENLEISAQVPVQDVEQVDKVSELLFEDSAKQYALSLRTVVPAVNTATRNREVRLVFKDVSALPGSAGKLTWKDNRPHVPGKLLVRRGHDFGLFLYDNGRARFHVIPDAQQGRATPVSFAADTLFIVEGQYSLQDGQAIKKYP